MTDNTERAAFEAWFASQPNNRNRRPNRAASGDGYYTDSTDRMWQAWQARAALPVREDKFGDPISPYHLGNRNK